MKEDEGVWRGEGGGLMEVREGWDQRVSYVVYNFIHTPVVNLTSGWY